MPINDELDAAWKRLEFCRKALAVSVADGRPVTDPLRKEQIKAHEEAAKSYLEMSSKL